MLVHVLAVNAHKSRRAPHIPYGSVAVGSVFHQESTCLQQQVQFLPDFRKGLVQYLVLVLTQKYPYPFPSVNIIVNVCKLL